MLRITIFVFIYITLIHLSLLNRLQMTIQNSSNQTRNPPEHEHRMAKGTLYLMIAQVIFLGSGYIIHFGLARMVSADVYGRFGVILSILTLTQIFLLQGIPEAVTKYIAEGRDSRIVTKKATELQFIFSLILFFGLLLLAPYIAEILHDEKLTNYLRFVSFIIPIRAMSSLYRGVLNGFEAFGKTTIGEIMNSFPRVIFVFLFVYLGFELFGVIGGYIVGSFLALLVFAILSRNLSESGNSIGNKELINFSYPIIIFAFFFSLIPSLDLLFVKSLIEEGAMAGYYTAARTIPTIFGVVSMGLTITLLPSISKSYQEKNIALTKSYINNSLRYALMILLPSAFIFSATSSELLSFLFGAEYSKAGGAFSILVFGWLFLYMFLIMSSIINGSGKTKIPMYISLFILPICIFSNYFLIPIFGLKGAALATTITCLIGISFTSFFVYRIFGAFMKPKSTIKIIGASSLVFIISWFIKFDGFFLIGEYITLFGIYFGLLFLIKEIKKEDIDLVLGILKFKQIDSNSKVKRE